MTTEKKEGKEKRKKNFPIFSPLTKKQKTENGKTQKELLKNLEKAEKDKDKKLKKKLHSTSVPKTAQESIKYKKMFEDGICIVEDGIYSKTLKFTDVNYQIAKGSIQEDIFNKFCELYNAQSSDTFLQLSLINKYIDHDEFKNAMFVNNENFKLYSEEHNMMLAEKALEGNNSIVKDKYLTYTVQADSLATARYRLASVESDLFDRFKSIGSRVRILDGKERLNIIHSINRPDERLEFEYSDLFYSGKTTKDYVAPSSFDFGKNKAYYEFGERFGQVMLVKDIPTEMSDDILKRLTDIPINVAVSIHIRPHEHEQAIELVRSKLALMNQQIEDIRRNARKKEYSEDSLPEEIAIIRADAQQLLEDLRENKQNLFFTTILIQTSAKTIEDLTDNVFKIMTVLKSASCKAELLDYQQEDALSSIYPLGLNRIEAGRNLTTAAVSVFMPMTTQELFDVGGFYYGQNSLSKNLIFFNRKLLNAPNGWILGSPGSGKSFAGKREVVNTLLGTEDDVIVIDPEREYVELAKGFNGEVVEISADSKSHINPFDMDIFYADDDNPVTLKIEFILSLCEMMSGNISSERKSIIDRVARKIYTEYLSSKGQKKVPTLKDFYEELRKQEEKEAKSLAIDIEIYATGSLNVFANETNVNVNNRFLVFDICNLGHQLKSLGMLVVLDQVWNRIIQNRKKGKRTWLYIDEIQLLFQNDYSTNYFDQLWSRARKWGAIPTGITQNVDRLIHNNKARQMLSNSDFILILRQSGNDRDELQSLLSLSFEQIKYVSGQIEAGSGIIYAAGATIPFSDRFKENTELYKLMTTKPEDIVKYKLEEESVS